MTLPPIASQILRLLSESPRGTDRLFELMPGLARSRITQMLNRLRADGLVAPKKGKWHVSKAGRRAAPSAPPPMPWSPYVPPVRPPRRPGSDHSHLPSVAGGQLVRRR